MTTRSYFDAALVSLSNHRWNALACGIVVALATGTVDAQFSTGFEPPTYNASSDGVDLNGQDEFFNPDPPVSVSALVYTYDGNALGLPSNPGGGGAQFVGATGPAGNMFARSQRLFPYGDGTGIWTTSFDVAVTFSGGLPSAQNVGSFSTQLFPSEATFIALARWLDPVNAESWNADYVWFNAAGTQLIESVSDPGFQGLETNHWYRWSTTFDLDTNRIVSVAITDLTTGNTTTNKPVDKYLFGGAGGAPPPTGLRLFAGAATTAGNVLAFDNIDVSSESVIAIMSSDPPDNAIDARQPSEPDGSNTSGWSEVLLDFNGATAGLSVEDFTITTDPPGKPPFLAFLFPDGNSVLLQFGDLVPDYFPTGRWTIITHNDSGSSVRLGFLPADVNNDSLSNANDVLELIDHLNGVLDLASYQTDVDRSNQTNANDVLRVIDLLNGAGEYDVWLGATLPP